MRKGLVPCILVFALFTLVLPIQLRADQVAWATRMGGADNDNGLDLAVDGAGNSYLTGNFAATAEFGPYNLTSAGLSDIFVTKLDSNSSVQWVMRMGGTGFDNGISIALDGVGNAYVTGEFVGIADFGTSNLISTGDRDIFVAKLDSNGSFQWAIRMGGSDSDSGYDIAVDGDGNAYVTGVFVGNANFGAFNLTSVGSEDIFVAKLDNTGTVEWAKRMGGADRDFGNGIALNGNGDAYLTGSFIDVADFGSYSLTSAGLYNHDAFVAKLDNAGSVQWAMRMGGVSFDEGKGISLDRTGNIYVSGTFSYSADFGQYQLTSKDEGDAFVTKLNKSGKVHWATRMGSTRADYGADIVVDRDGNAYVTGTFYDVADFGPYTLTPVGSYDAFVTKLDRKGTIQWAMRMGGSGPDYSLGTGQDVFGNKYVTGYFTSGDFGPYYLTSAGHSDIFVIKLVE